MWTNQSHTLKLYGFLGPGYLFKKLDGLKLVKGGVDIQGRREQDVSENWCLSLFFWWTSVHTGHSPRITHSGRHLRHSLVCIAELAQTGFSGIYPKPPRMESACLGNFLQLVFSQGKSSSPIQSKTSFFNLGPFHHVTLWKSWLQLLDDLTVGPRVAVTCPQSHLQLCLKDTCCPSLSAWSSHSRFKPPWWLLNSPKFVSPFCTGGP